MASISSVISLFVLLLATYCYSVPIVTDDDYTTYGYEYATGKPLAERESTGFTLPEEYTTVFSTIHQKREDAENKDDQAANVQKREDAVNNNDKDIYHEERSLYDETTPEAFEATSVVSKRSDKHDSSESESHEKTTQHSLIEDAHKKTTQRSLMEDAYEKTTQRSLIEGAHQKRYSFDESTSTPFEATSATNKRSVGTELSGKFTTQRSVINEAHPKRDSSDEVTSSPFEATSIISERSVDTEVSDELTTERSYAERDLESDSFITFESSTQFNDRVGQIGERESVDVDTTTVFEPTSSGESFSQATGLLHQREGEQPIKGKLETEQPEIYYQKTETIVPGKITKTEFAQGENQSYAFKGLSVEQQVSSFSEGTTEENDSKTNADH